MKLANVVLPLVGAIGLFFGTVSADLCLKGSKMMDGNSYCQEIKSVKYMNVGNHGGIYNEVFAMDTAGTCSTRPKHFSGSLAPFDEEMSVHLKGPIAIKQFAVYTLKKSDKALRGETGRRHIHQHDKLAHQAGHNHKAKKDMVVATIDGLVQSWENNWFGSDTASVATTLSTGAEDPGAKVAEPITTVTVTDLATTTTTTCIVSEISSAKPTNPASTTTAASDDDKNNPKPKHVYLRTSYYDSISQTAENVVFLGNHGGQGSGVFDLHFGASLSYVNQEGTGGSPSPQILADTVIPSGSEITIMTGEECNKHNCGYSRPGSVAYRGFDDADKVFFVEFGMPLDGKTGWHEDMPAVWLLNANIPRTQQYGACSCWPSCGELDIAECLSVGSHYLKSTVHADASRGDSDYFNRPVTGTITIATIFRGDEIYIGIVPNQKFPDKLTNLDIDHMIAENAWSESDFPIA